MAVSAPMAHSQELKNIDAKDSISSSCGGLFKARRIMILDVACGSLRALESSGESRT